MQKLKGLLLTTFLAFSSAFFVEAIVLVDFTEKVEAACAPGNYYDSATKSCKAPSSGTDPEAFVKGDLKTRLMKIYNVVATVFATGSILVIIYGAYLLVTSAGNYRRVSAGKFAIFSAGIAIIILLSSYTIMRLIYSFLEL